MNHSRGNKHYLFCTLFSQKQNYLWFVLLLFLMCLSGTLQTGIAWYLGGVVDAGVARDVSRMYRQGLFMGLLVAAEFIRINLYTLTMTYSTERLFRHIRLQIFRTIADADYAGLEKSMQAGDVVIRVNNDIMDLNNTLTGSITWLLRVTITAVISLISCFVLSWQLSLAYFTFIPLFAWIERKLSLTIKAHQKEASAQMGRIAGTVAGWYRGLLVIKSFLLQNRMEERFGAADVGVLQAQMSTEQIAVRMTLARMIYSFLSVFVIFGFGIVLIRRGVISVGNLITFTAVSQNVREAVNLIDNMLYSLRTANAKAERVWEALQIPTEKNEDAQIQTEDPAAPAVDVKDLSFGYSDGLPVLRGLSLSVSRGQTIGIMGSNGSGKSTLLKLLSGIYPIQRGDMTLFGVSVSAMPKDVLRDRIAVITQEPCLFDTSIYENILLGRTDAAAKEVRDAVAQAGLLPFLESLPDGIDTQIGQGGLSLSGGQRQRIAIARALVKDAPILLMDEPTASLDAESEKQLQEVFSRLLTGRTALIVSHRLAFLQQTDHIYCLDHGCVAQEGTFDELAQAPGLFREMLTAERKEA